MAERERRNHFDLHVRARAMALIEGAQHQVRERIRFRALRRKMHLLPEIAARAIGRKSQPRQCRQLRRTSLRSSVYRFSRRRAGTLPNRLSAKFGPVPSVRRGLPPNAARINLEHRFCLPGIHKGRTVPVAPRVIHANSMIDGSKNSFGEIAPRLSAWRAKTIAEFSCQMFELRSTPACRFDVLCDCAGAFAAPCWVFSRRGKCA